MSFFIPFYWRKILEKRSKKILYIVVAVLAVLFLALVVSRILNSKLFADKVEEVKKNPVTVIEVKNGTVRRTLFYTGDLHAEKEVTVYSVVPGKLIRYNYREGDRVAKGSTLVLLERTETWDEFKPVVVESPISGIVAINHLDRGELATTQTPLSMVVGGRGIKVSIKVTDIEFASIKKEMEAELTVPAFPGKVFRGKVSKVAPVIRRDTRTAPVEIFFKNEDRLLMSGMFGDIRIIVEEKEKAINIPFDTLLFESEGMVGPYCFVVEGGNTARKRKLTTGIIDEGKVEILSGLKAGEFVVDLGKENLKNGTEVLVIDKSSEE